MCSMISVQCDELRAMAESVGLEMPQAATLMMEAADTILVLREVVRRERAEADRLREELEAVGTAAYLYGRDDFKTENAKLRKRVAELEELLPDSGRWYRAETVEAYVAEIAKLRELVRELYEDQCDEGDQWRYRDRMSELGVVA